MNVPYSRRSEQRFLDGGGWDDGARKTKKGVNE